MAYSSVSISPAKINANSTAASSALVLAASASDVASAATVAAAGASNTASAASAAAAGVSNTASEASVAAAAAVTAAGAASTAASSALAQLTSAIFSNPGSDSFVIKEWVRTSAGELKAKYSTAAVA